MGSIDHSEKDRCFHREICGNSGLFNEKIDMMEYHLNELCKDKSEGQAVLEMRSHLLNYLKGLPENKEIKNEICKCKSRIEIINCLEDYRKKLISLD